MEKRNNNNKVETIRRWEMVEESCVCAPRQQQLEKMNNEASECRVKLSENPSRSWCSSWWIDRDDDKKRNRHSLTRSFSKRFRIVPGVIIRVLVAAGVFCFVSKLFLFLEKKMSQWKLESENYLLSKKEPAGGTTKRVVHSYFFFQLSVVRSRLWVYGGRLYFCSGFLFIAPNSVMLLETWRAGKMAHLILYSPERTKRRGE